MFLAKRLTMLGLATLFAACGGDGGSPPGDAGSDASVDDGGPEDDGAVATGCPNLAGEYHGTEALGENTCRLTPHVFSPSPTLTITQDGDACAFTLANSAQSDVAYDGRIDADARTLSWTTDPASYSDVGGYTTVTSVSLSYTLDDSGVATLDGDFAWSWSRTSGGAAVCTGTTTFTGYTLLPAADG